MLAGCAGWLALVLAPAFAAENGEFVRYLLHTVCHQIPERSFHVLGVPLGACHRCTGLYVGFTLGVLAWPWLPVLAHKMASNPRMVTVFFVPLLIDWAVVANTPATRFATGVIAGFPVALLCLLALVQWRDQSHSKYQEQEQ